MVPPEVSLKERFSDKKREMLSMSQKLISNTALSRLLIDRSVSAVKILII